MGKFKHKIILLVTFHLFAVIFGATTAWAYSTSGFKWAGTSVNYYINNVFAASFQTAMKAADATWDAAGSKFKFNYADTTNRNPNAWSYSTDGFSDIGYFYQGNTGVIAVVALTHGGITTPNGTIISERDTTLNTYYGLTTVGAAGKYDVQNLMTHEFGHWLKLLDVNSGLPPSWCSFSWESTMCYKIWSTGEIWKRILETDDKNGIKAIYGT